MSRSVAHHAKSRAAAANRFYPYQRHAAAEQAFVLIDAGATANAVDLLDHARHRTAIAYGVS